MKNITISQERILEIYQKVRTSYPELDKININVIMYEEPWYRTLKRYLYNSSYYFAYENGKIVVNIKYGGGFIAAITKSMRRKDCFKMYIDKSMFTKSEECAEAVIAHEFAHIVQLKDRTNWECIKTYINYFIDKTDLEDDADRIATEKGFDLTIIDKEERVV